MCHIPSNPLRDDLSDEVVYGRKHDRDILLAKRSRGFALPESEIPQEHPEIECFFGAIRLRAVLRLLGG